MRHALNHTTVKALCVVAAIAMLTACDQGATPQSANMAGEHKTGGQYESAGGHYEIVTDIRQTMQWILEPAADVIWDSAGFIITIEGEEDLSPETQAGWNTVLYAASTLAEAGNLLMMPGRSAGDDWVEYSKGLIQASREAMDAAQAMDADALFDAGGRIYQVCRACHNQYWVKDDQEALE